MSAPLLQIEGLSVRVEDKEILHGIDLQIKKGETHVLMGPNGAGKSTLGYALMEILSIRLLEERSCLRVRIFLKKHRIREQKMECSYLSRIRLRFQVYL